MLAAFLHPLFYTDIYLRLDETFTWDNEHHDLYTKKASNHVSVKFTDVNYMKQLSSPCLLVSWQACHWNWERLLCDWSAQPQNTDMLSKFASREPYEHKPKTYIKENS